MQTLGPPQTSLGPPRTSLAPPRGLQLFLAGTRGSARRGPGFAGGGARSCSTGGGARIDGNPGKIEGARALLAGAPGSARRGARFVRGGPSFVRGGSRLVCARARLVYAGARLVCAGARLVCAERSASWPERRALRVESAQRGGVGGRSLVAGRLRRAGAGKDWRWRSSRTSRRLNAH